jgi:hypothetical protein
MRPEDLPFELIVQYILPHLSVPQAKALLCSKRYKALTLERYPRVLIEHLLVLDGSVVRQEEEMALIHDQGSLKHPSDSTFSKEQVSSIALRDCRRWFWTYAETERWNLLCHFGLILIAPNKWQRYTVTDALNRIFDNTFFRLFEGVLCKACLCGRLNLVRYLIEQKQVDPGALGNLPIRWAAQKGHTTVVDYLLKHPQVDPTSPNQYNFALIAAYDANFKETVRLLWEDIRVKNTYKYNKRIEQYLSSV